MVLEVPNDDEGHVYHHDERNDDMQSMIADHAKSKAEYLLLMTILATGLAQEHLAGHINDGDLYRVFTETLDEFRALPEVV